MNKKKVAVIGCGTIGTTQHIPAYIKNEKAEIKYFCDLIPEKAQAMVDEYGCGTVVTDYKQILNDPEIEAVSVCVPNNMHVSLGAVNNDARLTEPLENAPMLNITGNVQFGAVDIKYI